ncbi:hypothetical protein [Limnoglobus roseus]|nr:hypothetical protein [Limnoglobus roseus]
MCTTLLAKLTIVTRFLSSLTSHSSSVIAHPLAEMLTDDATGREGFTTM